MKKNSCTPINPKKYSCNGLNKIHAKNLITKKNSCSSKIPLPPHNFSNGRSLIATVLFICINNCNFICINNKTSLLRFQSTTAPTNRGGSAWGYNARKYLGKISPAQKIISLITYNSEKKSYTVVYEGNNSNPNQVTNTFPQNSKVKWSASNR